MAWVWISRCVPGLSIIGLVGFLVHVSNCIRSSTDLTEAGTRPLSLAAKIFIGCSILVELDLIWIVLRVSLAMVNTTKKTKEVLKYRTQGLALTGSKPEDRYAVNVPGTEEIIHVIIIPNFCEDIGTLRTTLGVLASHPRASLHYEIVLAMEMKEVGAVEKSTTLIAEFKDFFLNIRSTFHPAGLPGEMAGGKGANLGFAAQEVLDVHGITLRRSPACNIIVTVMDADTHLWQDYFTEIRQLHLMNSNEAEDTIYTCPNIFDRNSNHTPFLVRCMDMAWSMISLSTMYPGSCLPIPVSVYSLPLSLIQKVGGWDTDHTAIGEDVHMMLKCYFETQGKLVSRVVHVPASQCNVSSTGQGLRQSLSILSARYTQGLRHMWGGALDMGFALRQGISHRLVLRFRFLLLLFRLYEAYLGHCHVLIVQLFCAAHLYFIPSTHIDPVVAWTMRVVGLLSLLSVAGMCVSLALYHRWYSLCLESRRKDMLASHITCPLLQVDRVGFSPRTWWHLSSPVEAIGILLAGIGYGCVPLFHAAFCQLWTDHLEYQVSKKPVFSSSDFPEL